MATTTMMKAVLLLMATALSWSSVADVSKAQRAPCYECELFKQQHPDSKPYEQIRSQCTYPCECSEIPACPDGVHLITDGCGCCLVCARQLGDVCDGTFVCDEDKGLVCDYTATKGTCRGVRGASCTVNNVTYADGESFQLDCRTRCSCQNGTYGCVSLCTQEDIRPSARCTNPRLVALPDRCCREWMCDWQVIGNRGDDDTVSTCEKLSTDWSPCSTTCGVGVSLRLSNDNEACQTVNETRLCQLRPCTTATQQIDYLFDRSIRYHHIRKSHLCRATIRPPRPEKLTHDNCSSLRALHLKQCGSCAQHTCCVPQYTTTIHEQFECHNTDNDDITHTSSLVTYPVMSILKCVCPLKCEQQAHDNHYSDVTRIYRVRQLN